MATMPRGAEQLFWDYPGQSLSLDTDRDLVVERILSAGTWEQVKWLRRQVGDAWLADWITGRQGRGLDARRLRFWQVVLRIDKKQVDAWLARPEQRIWNDRRVKC